MTARALAPEPGSLRAWVLAARPKTLTAAFVPVLVGTASALRVDAFAPWPALAALFGAILIQIGTNFANDVFDHDKGADTEARVGPTRAVQAGLLAPRAMRIAMLLTFAAAVAVGVYLTWVAGWAVVVIGVLSIASGIAYTGGPYPLGYHGLGDVFVMVFFGFVAVCGTVFVQAGHVPLLAVLASVPVGALITAILVVNNVRDRQTDRVAGKRTLAVRFGKGAGVAEYALLAFASYAVPPALYVTGQAPSPFVLLPCVTAPLAVRLCLTLAREEGPALNRVLEGTAKLVVFFGLPFAFGLAMG